MPADQPTFALCRILGNDLPPLHTRGQTLANLRFVLEHEPTLPRCRKMFLLNRVIDPQDRATLFELLAGSGHDVHVLDIDPAAYGAVPTIAARSAYLTHNNAARNVATELALATGADVALPFDGQTCFTAQGWARLLADVDAHPDAPAYVVPMVRLLDNAELLADPPVQRDELTGPSEPQLGLARRCPERFDESVPYGRGPKIELLMRLGIAGPWDSWRLPYWVDLRARPRSPLAGRCVKAGACHRLAAGNSLATQRIDDRQQARRAGIAALVARADAQVHAS